MSDAIMRMVPVVIFFVVLMGMCKWYIFINMTDSMVYYKVFAYV